MKLESMGGLPTIISVQIKGLKLDLYKSSSISHTAIDGSK